MESELSGIFQVKLVVKDTWALGTQFMLTERSYILKQTSSFQLQVCLSMSDLFVTTGH